MSKEECFSKIESGDTVYLFCDKDCAITSPKFDNIDHIGIYNVVPNIFGELVVPSRYNIGFYSSFGAESLVRIKKKAKLINEISARNT